MYVIYHHYTCRIKGILHGSPHDTHEHLFNLKNSVVQVALFKFLEFIHHVKTNLFIKMPTVLSQRSNKIYLVIILLLI